MEEQKLKNIWKKSSENQDITMNTEQLIRQFKTGMQQREQIVRRRDNREIITAIILIVGFSILAVDFFWSPASVGLFVTIGAFINFIYVLRSNRKSKFTQDLFVSIKQQLRQQRKFMIRQFNLLKNVLYWAVIPLLTGYMLIVWSIWDISKYEVSSIVEMGYPNDLNDKITSTVIVLIAGAYMAWQNRKASRVNWQPLIKQIDTVIESLEREEK